MSKDLHGADLMGRDLRGIDLSQADLSDAKLVGSNLEGANLRGANLKNCELLRANLKGADLTECDATSAGFGNADLSRATLFGAQLASATFTKATLSDSDLRSANLHNARLRDCDLSGADLSRADLSGADLTGARVNRAHFFDADLSGAKLSGIRDYSAAYWIGANIVAADFCGAYMARRMIADQNYLYEFRTQSRANAVAYWIWWATSDCGRSLARWGAWIAVIVMAFAGIYQFVEIDFGAYRTPLSPIYFSVVTLTTLGYGDVLPISMPAQLVTMAEVFLGYVMLGGLLSIFANKMARRAD